MGTSDSSTSRLFEPREAAELGRPCGSPARLVAAPVLISPVNNTLRSLRVLCAPGTCPCALSPSSCINRACSSHFRGIAQGDFGSRFSCSSTCVGSVRHRHRPSRARSPASLRTAENIGRAFQEMMEAMKNLTIFPSFLSSPTFCLHWLLLLFCRKTQTLSNIFKVLQKPCVLCCFHTSSPTRQPRISVTDERPCKSIQRFLGFQHLKLYH